MGTATKNTAAPERQDGLDLSKGGQGWRPKAGDELTGILRRISRGWSDWQNAFYPILTIEKEDGSLADVHAFHAVLLNRILALKPESGEYVGVKCHGSEKTKDGKRTVTVYSFDVSRPEGSSVDPYAGYEPAHAEAEAETA